MIFEHQARSLKEVEQLLSRHNVRDAIIKPLSKNHNDKNQVYSGSDFKPLIPFFDVEFQERTACISSKKGGSLQGKSIIEANIIDFFWLDKSGSEVRARNVKMITYPQYPETRLSGFQTVDGTMPSSMSVEFTKAHPQCNVT